jgi:hypothetical protein
MEFESLLPKDRQRNIIIHAPVKTTLFHGYTNDSKNCPVHSMGC